MEHVKIRNRDVQEERGFYEMPLVNYNSDRHYNNRVNNDYRSTGNPVHEIDVSNESCSQNVDEQAPESKNNSQGAGRQKLSYVWVEAFFCAIILLGILIIQNVKNTEGLQLSLRQEIRHNLTAQELIDVRENLEEMMQKYKNARP